MRICHLATLGTKARSSIVPDHQNSDASAAHADTGAETHVEAKEKPRPEDPTSGLGKPVPTAKNPSAFARTLTIRNLSIATAAALIVGGFAGAVIGYAARPAVVTTAEYKSMQNKLGQELSDTKSQLAISTSDLDAANQHVSDIKDRETALAAGEAKLKADQAALDSQTKQVQSTEFGDGIHIVGSTVTPGVYSISNASSCYYAWMSSTGAGADIIDNNIVSGPAVVTLNPGDIFETSRCGTWTKIG